MKRLMKSVGLLLVILIAMSLLSGCWYYESLEGKITGGGWFNDTVCVEGVPTETKCTFGFNAQGLLVEENVEVCHEVCWHGHCWEKCELCDVYNFKGQFQFNDHVGTKVHAQVDGLFEVYEIVWMGPDEFVGYGFSGETKDGEELRVLVSEDGSEIQINYGWQEWGGMLEGGNITIH